jgi:hypothetical protein
MHFASCWITYLCTQPALFFLDLFLDTGPFPLAEIAHTLLPFSPVPNSAQTQYLLSSVPVFTNANKTPLILTFEVNVWSRPSGKQAMIGWTGCGMFKKWSQFDQTFGESTRSNQIWMSSWIARRHA